MTKEAFSIGFLRLSGLLLSNRLSMLRLWLLSLVITAGLAQGLAVSLELLMRGTVDYDYLLTVFVFALLASSVVGAMLIAFLDREGMEYFSLPLSEMSSRLIQQPGSSLPDRADSGSYSSSAAVAAKQSFVTQLERATAASARAHQYGALLSIHLGSFAAIGLEGVAKDLLAQQITQRIASCVRKSDTVVQVNEEEFAVLLEGLGPNMIQACVRARKIAEHVIFRLKSPLRLKNFKGVCQPNIGVVVFGELSVPSHAIFKSASFAMYQAIACGINNIQFFDAALEQDVMEHINLAEAFHHDLGNDKFMLISEAQVNLQQQITGVELLPKWHRSQYAELEPHAVFQLAENLGMGVELGEWMLAQAAHCLASWSQYPQMQHLEVAVKIGRSQFSAANFVENIRALLIKTQSDSRKLKLELDEETLADVEQAAIKIRALQDMGIGITLDDFGNTRASLSSLRKLPIDEIKIAGALVKYLQSDSADMAIIKAVVAIGKQRDVNVIAAGAGEQVREILFKEAGCQRFQVLQEPMLLREFEQLLCNTGSRSDRPHFNLDSTNRSGWL